MEVHTSDNEAFSTIWKSIRAITGRYQAYRFSYAKLSSLTRYTDLQSDRKTKYRSYEFS